MPKNISWRDQLSDPESECCNHQGGPAISLECEKPGPITINGTVSCSSEGVIRVEDAGCVLFYNISDADSKYQQDGSVAIARPGCRADIHIPAGHFADADEWQAILNCSTLPPPPLGDCEPLDPICAKLIDLEAAMYCDSICCDGEVLLIDGQVATVSC